MCSSTDQAVSCFCQTVAPPAANKITPTKGKEAQMGGGGGYVALTDTVFLIQQHQEPHITPFTLNVTLCGSGYEAVSNT